MRISMRDIKAYWWEGRKFKHPETGHMVQFKSLPLDEQKRLNDSVQSKQEAPKTRQPKQEVPKTRQPKQEVPKINKKVTLESLPKDFNDTTPEQRLSLATYKDVVVQRNKNLSEIAKKTRAKINVTGQIDDKKLLSIKLNMVSEAYKYSDYLAPDTVERVDALMSTTNNILRRYSKEFRKVDAAQLDELCRDLVKTVVHCEIESNRQQYTDHGVRHLVGNIDMQQNFLNQLEAGGTEVTGRERLMSVFIMAHHDIGYTSQLVREGDLRGIMASGEHPKYSQKIVAEQKKIWDVDKIFSSKEYDRISKIVGSHDTPLLNTKDELLLTTTLSDNLALFQKEKLPSMFKYVSGGDELLVKMGLASKNKDEKKFEHYRKQLHRKIEKSALHSNMKRDLKMASSRLSQMTPKFTLGVLAGEVKSVSSDDKNMFVVKVKYNKHDAELQRYFEMGQKQTKAMLEDYGVKDYSKREYSLGKGVRGKSILKLEIV